MNPDGWQQESTPLNDFYTLAGAPCSDETGQEVMVSVNLPTGEKYVSEVWHIDVGRVDCIYSTPTFRRTSTEYREITDQLYGGDTHKRIRQEIVLGIGGYARSKSWASRPPFIT